MARVKWGKHDLGEFAKLAAIFVAIGAALGLLRDSIVSGAVAGAMLFALMIGVGWLAGFIGRD